MCIIGPWLKSDLNQAVPERPPPIGGRSLLEPVGARGPPSKIEAGKIHRKNNSPSAGAGICKAQSVAA
jgi:hypothetical protein